LAISIHPKCQDFLPANKSGVEKSHRNATFDDIEKTIPINCVYASNKEDTVEGCRSLTGSLLSVFFEIGVADSLYL
jgi:hypothetical protein